MCSPDAFYVLDGFIEEGLFYILFGRLTIASNSLTVEPYDPVFGLTTGQMSHDIAKTDCPEKGTSFLPL
jgi:hypothetical protein